MTREAIQNLLNRQPFESLRIKTSNGEVYEVRHPEMVLLTKSTIIVTRPDADGSPSDVVEFISYLHVASVETTSGQAA